MKINPYNLKRPKKENVVIEVTDEANPDVVVKFTLRHPDIPVMVSVGENASKFADKYLQKTPDGDDFPFFPVDGETPVLSSELCTLACALSALQVGPAEDRYDPEEIIALLCTMPSGMLRVIDKVKEMVGEFIALTENPTGAVILPSPQSSPKKLDNIQKSSTEQMPYSGQSTNDSQGEKD